MKALNAALQQIAESGVMVQQISSVQRVSVDDDSLPKDIFGSSAAPGDYLVAEIRVLIQVGEMGKGLECATAFYDFMKNGRKSQKCDSEMNEEVVIQPVECSADRKLLQLLEEALKLAQCATLEFASLSPGQALTTETPQSDEASLQPLRGTGHQSEMQD